MHAANEKVPTDGEAQDSDPVTITHLPRYDATLGLFSDQLRSSFPDVPACTVGKAGAGGGVAHAVLPANADEQARPPHPFDASTKHEYGVFWTSPVTTPFKDVVVPPMPWTGSVLQAPPVATQK